MKQTTQSFSEARKIFAVNLTNALAHLGYSAGAFALKLAVICESDPVSVGDVYHWLAGSKVPSTYALFKLSQWLRIPMGSLFSPAFNPATVVAHSFANQQAVFALSDEDVLNQTIPFSEPLMAKSTKTVKPVAVVVPTTQVVKTNIATQLSAVALSKTAMKRMTEVVSARTDSKNYNLLLASKVYNCGAQLKAIAEKVGASTSALRDYAFYGVSVPHTVATNLASYFGTNYRGIGLALNKTTNRYEYLGVKVKA